MMAHTTLGAVAGEDMVVVVALVTHRHTSITLETKKTVKLCLLNRHHIPQAANILHKLTKAITTPSTTVDSIAPIMCQDSSDEVHISIMPLRAGKAPQT